MFSYDIQPHTRGLGGGASSIKLSISVAEGDNALIHQARLDFER
jgi:hypothetical protein